MNAVELIPIREHNGKQAVSGRDLHGFLQITTPYTKWFERMLEYGFTAGVDHADIFVSVPSEAGGREYEQKDHALSLDMAKELGMIQRTELGRRIRQYFIEVEKRSLGLAQPKTLEERTLELVGELHSKVQEQQRELVEIRPLAAQARTHNLGKGDAGKQAFAREIIKWGLSEGFQVKQPQVIEFISRKLDMFVIGNRSDHGDATLSGERRGLSTTVKGVADHNGHPFHTGKLTPKGVEYAWARIETYVREHGHLELPKKEIAA